MDRLALYIAMMSGSGIAGTLLIIFFAFNHPGISQMELRFARRHSESIYVSVSRLSKTCCAKFTTDFKMRSNVSEII